MAGRHLVGAGSTPAGRTPLKESIRLSVKVVVMANRQLFARAPRGHKAPATDTVNDAGGVAYKPSEKEALAQYVATGCLGATFYASAEEQLDRILESASKCDVDFVAKAAVYGRKSAFMKDAPALLLAHLMTRGPEGLEAFKAAFHKVIDTPKMLRTFVQIVMSGRVGRKSLGTAPKRLIQQWFESRTDAQIFRVTGDKPSIAAVIKLAHPKPSTDARRALFGYLRGREHDVSALDPLVREYEAWKKDPSRPIPDVPFLMLTSSPLSTKQWTEIARQATWQTVRMNLNTFHRHGVFGDSGMVKFVADKLRNEQEVLRSRVFPYQLLVAYKFGSDLPMEIQSALQDAMEIATQNVPKIEGSIAVFPDVSSSMNSPVSGHRGSASSKVQCREVAALVAATLLRRNPDTIVLPFKEDVVGIRLNPRDSIMTIAQQIARCGSGGTNCSAPLRAILDSKIKVDMIVYASDNESWMDSNPHFQTYWSPGYTSSPTQTMALWEQYKSLNPKAKMVCIDMAPNGSRQAPTRRDILNIGGFSDEVFMLLREFSQEARPDHWVRKIESVDL